MVDPAGHLDPAAALLDDTVNDREAETAALAEAFGAEERLEDPCARGVCDAATGVRHRELDVSALRLRPRLVDRVDRHLAGANRERATLRHRFSSVRREMDEDGVPLLGIDLDRRFVRGERHAEHDRVAEERLYRPLGFRHDRVEVDDVLRLDATPAEREEVAGDRSAPIDGLSDVHEAFSRRIRLRRPFECVVGADRDHGEDVVEVVCDAPGEAMRSLHPLFLPGARVHERILVTVVGFEHDVDVVAAKGFVMAVLDFVARALEDAPDPRRVHAYRRERCALQVSRSHALHPRAQRTMGSSECARTMTLQEERARLTRFSTNSLARSLAGSGTMKLSSSCEGVISGIVCRGVYAVSRPVPRRRRRAGPC